MDLDIEHLRGWIGRTETMSEQLTPNLVTRFNATLDHDVPGTPGAEAPLMIHFCLAQPVAPASKLGHDGHPLRGGFLPPVPLPRRMWAGGEITFLAPLIIDQTVTRTSRIENVELKQGNSGRLCFVTVIHEYSISGKVAVRERQDVVYRDAPSKTVATPPPADAAPTGTTTLQVTADATMLFRYSAITFNGHRIHYDAPYARDDEGYGGLVVHGPLQATLMAHMAAEMRGAPPKKFAFRGLSPLFDDTPFAVHAAESEAGLSLWTARDGGPVAMQGQAIW